MPDASAAHETVRAALRRGADRLAAAHIEQPMREARLLLAHALGVDASALLDAGRGIPIGIYNGLLDRRAAREPMAHIRGRQGFWTLDLAVSADTLIPRADSETLITALAACPPAPRRLLDLGTGTGALLLAALDLFPEAWGVGVDRSTRALAVAAANARAHGLSERALFMACDWATAIAGRFDAVLANPPYIRAQDIARLMPEVAAHEPRAALDGGPDGLDAYRALLPGLAALLTSGGVAILEIGADQAAAVGAIAAEAGFPPADLRHDLGGNARALVLRAANG